MAPSKYIMLRDAAIQRWWNGISVNSKHRIRIQSNGAVRRPMTQSAAHELLARISCQHSGLLCLKKPKRRLVSASPPCSQWDFIAGLSVGAMVVPQGLSYAQIAAVPSVYGLYGAFMPCIIYALFGSSKQLAVGPVAVTSLLIGQGMLDILPGEQCASY